MKTFPACVSLALALVLAGGARAGVYSDDLAKCLVKSTSETDKEQLIVWIFSAMSAHPVVRPYVKFSVAERKQVTQQGADLFVRLLTNDCRKETVAAIKFEGTSSLESGVNVLGQVAVRGLMGHPDVAAQMSALSADFDKSKLEDLGRDAGVALKP